MDIGYIQRSILSMSEEEQKDFILSNANIDVMIPELDKRRMVLLELPNELEKGSRVYVATLAALGGTIRQIYSAVELYKEGSRTDSFERKFFIHGRREVDGRFGEV